MQIPTPENLATIRVVYLMPYTLRLAGIPYEMRRDVGQAPRHLYEASMNPPRAAIPRDYTNEWIDLDHPAAREFVARLRVNDDLPRYVHEWTTLPIGDAP